VSGGKTVFQRKNAAFIFRVEKRDGRVLSSSLKQVAAGFFERLVTFYQTLYYDIPALRYDDCVHTLLQVVFLCVVSVN
jgi:hypothetical protein